jgi:hypothetical protein
LAKLFVCEDCILQQALNRKIEQERRSRESAERLPPDEPPLKLAERHRPVKPPLKSTKKKKRRLVRKHPPERVITEFDLDRFV